MRVRARANGVPLYSLALSYAIPARIASNSFRDYDRLVIFVDCQSMHKYMYTYLFDRLFEEQSLFRASRVLCLALTYFSLSSLYQDKDTRWQPDGKLFLRSAFSAQIRGLIRRAFRSLTSLSRGFDVIFYHTKNPTAGVRAVPFSPCYPLAPRGTKRKDAGNFKALQRVLLTHRVQSARDSLK